MNTKRTTNLIWAGFFVSVIVYHGLLLSGLLPTAEQPAPALLAHVLLALGVIQLLLVVGFDLMMIGRPGTITVRPEMLPPGDKPVDERELARVLKARYYFMRVVIVLALAEAIGLYGLVLGLLGAEWWVVHTLFALSYTAMLYIRLRMSVGWERMYLG
jgi:hypothetical protein